MKILVLMFLGIQMSFSTAVYAAEGCGDLYNKAAISADPKLPELIASVFDIDSQTSGTLMDEKNFYGLSYTADTETYRISFIDPYNSVNEIKIYIPKNLLNDVSSAPGKFANTMHVKSAQRIGDDGFQVEVTFTNKYLPKSAIITVQGIQVDSQHSYPPAKSIASIEISIVNQDGQTLSGSAKNLH